LQHEFINIIENKIIASALIYWLIS